MDVVSRKKYRRVEFDGVSDALFPATTLAGAPHARVERFHGMYPDLPFENLQDAFLRAYREADAYRLAELGIRI